MIYRLRAAVAVRCACTLVEKNKRYIYIYVGTLERGNRERVIGENAIITNGGVRKRKNKTHTYRQSNGLRGCCWISLNIF